MTIEIRCRCGRQLQVPASGASKSGCCPFCKQVLRLIAPGLTETGGGFDAELLCIAGPGRVGEQLVLGGPGPITIGKLPDRHIRLADAAVSRSHCRLVRTDQGWRIEDQNSHNGTRVNDQRVEGCDLHDSDLVRIGAYEFKYVTWIEGSAAAAPAESLLPSPRHEPPAPAIAGEPPVPRGPAETGLDEDGLYALAEEEDTQPTVAIERPAEPAATAVAAKAQTDGPVCPSCQRPLPRKAKICVQCGIDLGTGRAILTTQEDNLDAAYAAVETIVGTISWPMWLGYFPIASEAFGTKKPWVIRGIAVLTVLVSMWFMAYDQTRSPKMQSYKDLMLWCGEAEPDPAYLDALYTQTSYGNTEAFEEKYEELAESASGKEQSAEELVLAAHEALPPEQRCLGQYRPSQLFTHVFLHAGILHLAGNMIFLFVFGSRVNALIGTTLTVALYPVLAVGSGLIQMASTVQGPPIPLLGASGAIMGLAGMYLVLFPVHKVHMVVWCRPWPLFSFRLLYKVFAVRGFWVVLFYIASDAAYIVFRLEDEVAHWAHFGGFLVGLGLALILLVSRLVNARGGDLLSMLLGRRAWAIVGRPRG